MPCREHHEDVHETITSYIRSPSVNNPYRGTARQCSPDRQHQVDSGESAVQGVAIDANNVGVSYSISRRHDRRHFLTLAGAAVTAGVCQRSMSLATELKKVKSVAAIVTVFRPNSHADVIVSKILRGWKHDGGPGPALRLASLYVDQFPSDDMSRKLSREHGFPICENIEQAITLGTGNLAVDGVLSIGEHGEYPWNDIGQHLYPRRRFFAEIASTLERYQRIVPVFNDKHLGPVWSDAKWMYDRAKELKIPLMAGSSLPVSFRDPDKTLPWKSAVTSCLGVGYSGLDIYGFHTLDYLQCILERRANAETGVRFVQCLPGESLEQLLMDGTIDHELLGMALRSSQTTIHATLKASLKNCAIFMIGYNDGLVAPVLMLPGIARAISAAFRTPDSAPVAVKAEERPEPRYPHFAYLLKGIEQMVHTGQPAYPVERTLLTAGMLDRLLTSRARNGKRLLTPELGIAYEPVDYPYAPHIDLNHDFERRE